MRAGKVGTKTQKTKKADQAESLTMTMVTDFFLELSQLKKVPGTWHRPLIKTPLSGLYIGKGGPSAVGWRRMECYVQRKKKRPGHLKSVRPARCWWSSYIRVNGKQVRVPSKYACKTKHALHVAQCKLCDVGAETPMSDSPDSPHADEWASLMFRGPFK